MKKILVVAAIAVSGALTGCFSSRDSIYANLQDAELVKIDTVERYVNQYQQLLTWKTSDNMEYVSYVPLNRRYVVGTRTSVLVRQ
jgi:hypothetical protein